MSYFIQHNMGQFVIEADVFIALFNSLTAVEEEACCIDWLQLLQLIETPVLLVRTWSEQQSILAVLCSVESSHLTKLWLH